MSTDNHRTEDALAFERVFLDTVVEMIQEKGLSVNEFAKMAFPEDYRSFPVRRFNTMLKKNKMGTPSRITLSDACLISEGLDIDLPYLILIVWQRLMHPVEPA